MKIPVAVTQFLKPFFGLESQVVSIPINESISLEGLFETTNWQDIQLEKNILATVSYGGDQLRWAIVSITDDSTSAETTEWFLLLAKE